MRSAAAGAATAMAAAAGGGPMVGFLFGNVNSKMQLQDDYLEEASSADRSLCCTAIPLLHVALATFGIDRMQARCMA